MKSHRFSHTIQVYSALCVFPDSLQYKIVLIVSQSLINIHSSLLYICLIFHVFLISCKPSCSISFDAFLNSCMSSCSNSFGYFLKGTPIYNLFTICFMHVLCFYLVSNHELVSYFHYNCYPDFHYTSMYLLVLFTNTFLIS